MKIKIYCEAGAMTTEVRNLKTLKNVELIGFPFESKNRRVFTASQPSELTSDNDFVTVDNANIRISDTDKSEKFDKIAKIIGENHYNDVRHIDTAYKENCLIFRPLETLKARETEYPPYDDRFLHPAAAHSCCIADCISLCSCFHVHHCSIIPASAVESQRVR